MATGDVPFRGTDPVSLSYQHVHKAPEPPDVRNPQIAGWLRDTILGSVPVNGGNPFWGHQRCLGGTRKLNNSSMVQTWSVSSAAIAGVTDLHFL